MEVKLKKYNTGYTQVLNEVLYDKTISLRAKGIYAYLFSKPDGWQFHMDIMEAELMESKGQMYTAIKELIARGYIKRTQVNEKGVFGGTIYEFLEPQAKEPCTEISAYGKTGTHNNTDILSNTDNLKKENIKEKEKTVKIEEGKFFLNIYSEEYQNEVRGLTEKQCDSLWKWIIDNFYGKELKISFIKKMIKNFNKGLTDV